MQEGAAPHSTSNSQKAKRFPCITPFRRASDRHLAKSPLIIHLLRVALLPTTAVQPLMTISDRRRAVGGLLVITLSLSLTLNGLPKPPYQWLLAAGGLGIAIGLAFPRINDRIPHYQQLALAAAGIGGFWHIIAESSGLVEVATSLLAGMIIAATVVVIGYRQRSRTTSQ